MFESPRPSAAVPPVLNNYIQPTFNHGLRIWWAFFWPTSLITVILTMAVNFVVKIAWQNSHISTGVAAPIIKYDNYVLSYLIALFVMDYILDKKFRHFRLALLTNQGGQGAQQLNSTLSRAVRVWWTYSWRTLIYRLIASFVASIPIGVILGVFTRAPAIQAGIGFLFTIAVDAAAGLFVIYSNIIDEDFGEFRVCLLPLQAPAAAVTPAEAPVQT